MPRRWGDVAVALAPAVAAGWLAWGGFVDGGAVRVIDGDTVAIEGERVRLAGIDAPDIPPRSKCVMETKAGRIAAAALREWLDGRALAVERHGRDMFGRTIGDLIDIRDGASAGRHMLATGNARPWTGTGRKPDFCKREG